MLLDHKNTEKVNKMDRYRRITLIIIALLIFIIIGGLSMAEEKNAPPLLNQSRIFPVEQSVDQGPPNPPLTPEGGAPPAPAGAPVPSPGVAPPPPPPRPAPMPQAGTTEGFLDNAIRAVDAARRARSLFVPGKVWSIRAPGGEVILKAAIMYQGMAVGVLEFSPLDGRLLPRGYKPRVYNLASMPIEQIRQQLPVIFSRLKALEGAEFREPEASWIIPLAFDGMIVAHIKVYYDGAHIVPDFPANQEMQAYGR